MPTLLQNMVVYAYDVDFICTDPSTPTIIEDRAPAILARWSLQMNSSKTDYTIIRRRACADADPTEAALDRAWRSTTKLGSALGTAEDITRRKALATLALRRLWTIWIRPHAISEATRVRLYNCYVLPVLLYNSGTWGPTATTLGSLDSFHRRQLRNVLGIRYPHRISSKALYRRCNTHPLSERIKANRWRLIGHIFRRPGDIPANLYMDQYFKPSKHGTWPGGPRTTLPRVVDNDLVHVQDHLRLTTASHLEWLRIIARDRQTWKAFTKKILGRPSAPSR